MYGRPQIVFHSLFVLHALACCRARTPPLPPLFSLSIHRRRINMLVYMLCVCMLLSSFVVLRTSRIQCLLLMLSPALARTPHAALLSLLCLLPLLRWKLRKPFRSLSPCLCVGRRVRMRSRGCGPSPLPFGSALALCDVRVRSWCLVLMGLLYLGVFPPPSLFIDAVRCSSGFSAPLVAVVVVGRGLCVECACVRAYNGRARGIPFGSLPCALEKANR